MSARKRILELLRSRVGEEVLRDEIQEAAGISEWARRVRELVERGWPIETTANGYVLTADEQAEVASVRVNISQKQRYRILARDHSRCCRCGRTVEDGVKLVIDHRIPVDWGGPTTDENLWTLCEECNHGKQAWQSDADANAMKAVLAQESGRRRLRAYFELRAGEVCTKEELQIVAQITDYQRRIRELREAGMNIVARGPNGDYVFEP